MKFKNTKKCLIPIFVLLSILTGCSKDEDNLEEEILISTSNTSFATPESDSVYTIKNLESGRTLDIQNKSNRNGANLQLWGTNANTSGTHRQWEIINVGGDYVRLKGVDSGKSLEVSGGSNSNNANIQQWTYQGTTHQQWEIISVGNGYFRIKNRDSGKSLTASGISNGSNVDQHSYSNLDTQKWFFTQVGSIEEETVAPNPTTISNPEPEEIINDDFISTNDGVFNLDDFQIESSSHLSSSTSTSTTSWSYDESDISGSEWYYLSGGDYYLKSAERDGKRTEFKEYPGKERSLNTNKVLTYEARVNDIPENGVTIAQVHNRGGVRRPYLRVYIEDGRIEVKETTNALTNSSGTYKTVNGPSYSENSKLKVQITTSNGSVNVKVETTSGTLEEDFTPSGDDDYENDYYLKAGVYTEGNNTEPEIRFYSFEKE